MGLCPTSDSAQHGALPKLRLLSNMGILPHMGQFFIPSNMKLETEAQCDMACV